MIDLDFKVEYRGPLFTGEMQNRIERAQRSAIRELVDYGWQLLNTVLVMRPAGVYLSVEEADPGKASKGYYRAHLHGIVQDSRYGQIDDSGVVYGPWLEGTSHRNMTTRFKGYASFRRTAQRVRAHAREVFISHLKRTL